MTSRWHQFLSEVTVDDKGLQEYLQRWFGYCLSGKTSEQKFLIIFGPPASGKSVFLEVIKYVWGDYATTINIQSLAVSPKTGNAVGRNCGSIRVRI